MEKILSLLSPLFYDNGLTTGMRNLNALISAAHTKSPGMFIRTAI